jgi:hypothetical protein
MWLNAGGNLVLNDSFQSPLSLNAGGNLVLNDSFQDPFALNTPRSGTKFARGSLRTGGRIWSLQENIKHKVLSVSMGGGIWSLQENIKHKVLSVSMGGRI